jgi:outer membrane protein OmpA-like peptidoglycan-associated protein
MDDDAPHLSPDGNTLYFSSKGRVGLGGYDVFKSYYDPQNRSWTEPVNLGYPINTVDDDIYFIPLDDEGKKALCASVRDNGIGDVDIFMIKEIPESERVPADLVAASSSNSLNSSNETTQESRKENTTELEKQTLNPTEQPYSGDKGDDQPVLVQVEVNKPLSGSYAAPPVVKIQHKASGTVYNVPIAHENGMYEVQLPKNQKGEYLLTVEQDGHLFESRTINPAVGNGTTAIRERISLSPASIGSSLVLRNIYFDFNKSNLKDDSYSEIIKVERLLREAPSMVLEIAGHTDNIGSKAYNRKLSLKRANAVINHLVAKGIPSNRLLAKGYGSDKPLASNDDEEEGREINRRIEFIVKGQ